MDSKKRLADWPGCVPACPACAHRHKSQDESESQKMLWLSKTLSTYHEKLGKIRGPESQSRLAYRKQAVLAAHWNEGWDAGMRKRDDIIPIPHCPVHDPGMNQFIDLIINSLPSPSSFPLAYVIPSGRQMSLVLKTAEMPVLTWLTDELVNELTTLGLQGLWIHLHPSTGKKIYGKGGWHLIWGEGRSTDEDGLIYGPGSFRQLIPSLMRDALDLTTGFLRPGPDTEVVDLYCGIGHSLRRWMDHQARCIGVEWSAEALECASVNASAAYLLRGLCYQRIPQLNIWLDQNEKDLERLLYVNPPRTGLEAEVIEWVCSTFRPQRIAYLSCSAGTLKRDLNKLESGGYHVNNIVPYDFFPQTFHVECLCLLSRD